MDALVDLFTTDATLISLLATDADTNKPAVYPPKTRNIASPVYPMITLGRVGDAGNSWRFDESDFAGLMDHPRLQISCWDKDILDNAEAVYRRVDQLLRGQSVSSAYIGTYSFKRFLLRDDLFDPDEQAYHIYSEWRVWTCNVSGIQIPIPATS